MVFLDGELPYETQASDHDWLDEYNKERARRKERHPLLMSLSRSTAWLRPATNNRLLAPGRPAAGKGPTAVPRDGRKTAALHLLQLPGGILG